MKKLTLSLLLLIAAFNSVFSQVTLYTEAPQHDGGTSSNRAPNGTSAHAFMRGCFVVLQSELTGIPANTNLTSFGFTLNTGTNINAVAGNFTVYLQNTSDVTYLKGTNYATAITGMTSVYASVMTVPTTATSSSITVTLSSPFTYTGGALYVAYDWASTGPFDLTAAVYRCNYLGLTPGGATGASASAAPATLGTTNFRPCFLFGTANTFTNDITVQGVEVLGEAAMALNAPQSIKALVKNGSNIAQTNISVGLNIAGANPFSNTQLISSLASGAVTTVTFASYSPSALGLSTVSVSVASDQNNANNLVTASQSVTCEQWAQNPLLGTYTVGVGFGAASGIIANAFSNPNASVIKGLGISISTDANTPGNSVYGVLMSSAGAIIATTNTLVLTAAMLGTKASFSFITPQNLTAATIYYIGLAQTTNVTAYYPLGATPVTFVPSGAFVTAALTGGVLTPLTQNLGSFGIEGVFVHNGLPATSSSPSVCTGGSVTLSVSGITSYTWSTGVASQSILVSPPTNTTYFVVGTNSLGCTVSTVVPVQVSPLLVTALSSTSSICVGSAVSFTAGGAVSYTWSATSGPVNTAVFTESPAITTTYVVNGSNNAGCSNTASITITVNSFTSMAVPASTAVCLGGTVTLNAGGAVSYTWNTGATTVNTSSVTTVPSASSLYTVSGENTLGCIDTRTVNIIVNSFTPGISSSTAVCMGSQITLTATGGNAGSYSWSGFNFQNLPITASVTASYSVTAVGANGCSGKNSTTVTVNANPTVAATPQRSVMCTGETNTLTASGAASYSWSTNATTSVSVISPTITTTLTYSVIGTNSAGCTDTGFVNVKVNVCTGLEEAHNTNIYLAVFPNPNTGLVNIHSGTVLQNADVLVYNYLGKLIKQQSMTSENTVLDLQNECNGIYFVHVLSNNKTIHISKIVKQ